MTQQCGASHPLRCPERTKAMQSGKCWYDHANHIWWWDWAGYPLPTRTCPGCGGLLPQMTQIVKRILNNDTPWDVTLGNPDE